jgi:hypothetical protein
MHYMHYMGNKSKIQAFEDKTKILKFQRFLKENKSLYRLDPSNSRLRNGSFKWQVCFMFYKMVLNEVTRHTK